MPSKQLFPGYRVAGPVVMGVSGSGKTDTSHAVADALRRTSRRITFTLRKTSRVCVPVHRCTDRVQWLQALIGEMQRTLDSGSGFVLACSALKRSYRELLRSAVPGLRFAHLAIDYDTRCSASVRDRSADLPGRQPVRHPRIARG